VDAVPLTTSIDTLRDDVKFAARQLRSAPTFTIVAAMTVALGIGANSAIFALVDATLLRPLPFRDPDRLVMLSEQRDNALRSRVAPLNLLDWNERNHTFQLIAGFVPSVGGMVMNGRDGTAETVPRQWVTQGFFDVLGVRAIAGRTFLPADDSNRSNVVVLSEGFWRTRFHADPTVVGRDIRLDGVLYTVVGVVPKDFQLVGRSSIWALAPLNNRRPGMRTAYSLQAIGRLQPDVTLDAAIADMAAVADGLAREFPATNKGRGVWVEPMHDALIGSDLRLTAILFLGVVGFVLLLCCANVANLLLARATVRARELALRSALGAGRRRVIRQLVTESFVLSIIGGTLGVGVGALILNLAPSVIPPGLLPDAVTLTFDMRVVAFCAAAAVIVGVVLGIAPAWHATAMSSTQVLASDNRTTTGGGGRARSLLVAGEVAAAAVLLVGAGLLLRTLVAIETVDRGYRAEGVLTMMVDPLGSRYPTAASLRQFFDAVEQEVMALPGVRGVAWTSALPMGPDEDGRFSFEIAGDAPVDESKRPVAGYQIVSGSYFTAIDLPIVAGRAFDDRDNRDGVPVCIVSEAFVRGYLQDRSPIGLQVGLRPASSPSALPVIREIVGVARQVKDRPDETDDRVQIYVPMLQNLVDDIYLVVQPTSGSASALAPSVRAAIGRVDQEQLVSVRSVMTLEDVASDASARHRFRAVMVTTFAALALLLAMVGVFGLLAYSVQQRARDFALRRALGATTRDVLRLAVGSAARVMVTGSIIGLMMSLVLGRLLTTMLFAVEPLDPMTFAIVTMLLALTAAIAVAGPAWRAVRIDPAVVLRGQ
jgi:putative ABC transport system permease protein